MDYLCKHNGPYYLAGEELARSLDNESLRGVVNIYYAMPIKLGTGSNLDCERGPDSMYRWAQVDGWRVIHYPHAGGSEAHVRVDGIGWVVDSDDTMPHEVWVILLALLGAPLVGVQSADDLRAPYDDMADADPL